MAARCKSGLIITPRVRDLIGLRARWAKKKNSVGWMGRSRFVFPLWLPLKLTCQHHYLQFIRPSNFTSLSPTLSLSLSLSLSHTHTLSFTPTLILIPLLGPNTSLGTCIADVVMTNAVDRLLYEISVRCALVVNCICRWDTGLVKSCILMLCRVKWIVNTRTVFRGQDGDERRNDDTVKVEIMIRKMGKAHRDSISLNRKR